MKRNFTIIIIIVIFMAFIFAGCTGRKIQEKINEEIVEKIVENASEDDVDVDIDKDSITIESEEGTINISGGDDVKWPKDVPKNIPIWKGKLVSSAVTDTTLMVGSVDVAREDFEAYVAVLEKAGYESNEGIDMAGVFMKQFTLDDTVVTVSYTEESKDITIIAEWE